MGICVLVEFEFEFWPIFKDNTYPLSHHLPFLPQMANASQSSDAKHPKLSNNSADRISILPESLLYHILSFLTTKQAARTSLLSKKWRFLWTCLPTLNILYWGSGEKGMSLDQRLNNILNSRREWSIRKFTLISDYEFDKIKLASILSDALEPNLEELDLLLHNYHFQLPRSLLSCKTIVVLKLGGHIDITFDSFVQFPSLKVLALWGVTLRDEDSFRILFAGCPVLDEVDIQSCLLQGALHYEIASLTLRRLFFQSCAVDPVYDPSPPNITVNAPALEHLTIEYEGAPSVLVLKNVHSLVQAIFKMVCEGSDSATTRLDWATMKSICEAVSNVRFLEMKFDVEQETDHPIPQPRTFPRFDNLVQLEVRGLCCLWSSILNMLHNCPRLECFTLLLVRDFTVGEEPQCWIPPEHVPNCLSFHLTTCKFQDFNGTESEMEFVRYLLKNSTVLRSMTITCSLPLRFSWGNKFGVLQDLCRFEKSSARCQLIF